MRKDVNGLEIKEGNEWESIKLLLYLKVCYSYF